MKKKYTKKQILESIKYWKKVLKQMNEEFGDGRIDIPQTKGRGVDLSKIEGTASNIIAKNMERFNSCKTKQDVIDLCHELFDTADLDTEWTRRFFLNLGRTRSYFDALYYVVNSEEKGAGRGLSLPSIRVDLPRSTRGRTKTEWRGKSGTFYSEDEDGEDED